MAPVPVCPQEIFEIDSQLGEKIKLTLVRMNICGLQVVALLQVPSKDPTLCRLEEGYSYDRSFAGSKVRKLRPASDTENDN